jgi:hypothetical protein
MEKEEEKQSRRREENAEDYEREVSLLFLKSNPSGLQSFFSGEEVHARMKDIRSHIIDIRVNWSEESFAQHCATLKKIVQKYVDNEGVMAELSPLWDSLQTGLSSYKWPKHRWEASKESLKVITWYTDKFYYDNVFGLVNRIFRHNDATEEDNGDTLKSSVFLTELINIGLFNLITLEPQLQQFSGPVYRGMVVPDRYIEPIKELGLKPIKERYTSIPLGLTSTTRTLQKAIQFALGHVHVGKVSTQNNVTPVLFHTSVVNVDPHHLKLYHRFFPKSIVSTICAVHIQSLSMFHDEDEVLFRGAFSQVVHVYNEEFKVPKAQAQAQAQAQFESQEMEDCQQEDAKTATMLVVQSVMVNANRDHISSVDKANNSDDARNMFRLMAEIARDKFAVTYCHEKGLNNDEKSFAVALHDAQQELDQLVKRLYACLNCCCCKVS